MTAMSHHKSDGRYRQDMDRAARELEAPVDRVAVIREAVRNLARRESPKASAMPVTKPSIGQRSARPVAPLPIMPTEQRRVRLQAAIAHLGRRGVLVWADDRDALIRKYRVTGRRELKFAEDVIEIAAAYGFEAPDA